MVADPFHRGDQIYLRNEKLISKNRSLQSECRRTGNPVPPPRLVYLVTGTFDLDAFLASGREAFGDVTQTCERNGIRAESFASSLSDLELRLCITH